MRHFFRGKFVCDKFVCDFFVQSWPCSITSDDHSQRFESICGHEGGRRAVRDFHNEIRVFRKREPFAFQTGRLRPW